MKNFKNFTGKYGVNTTTNFELINWAKNLNIKPFFCLMRDEIYELKKHKEFFAIVNIHKSNQKGVHWSCVHRNSLGNIFYFDSYGLDPTQEILNLRRSVILCNTFQLQKQGEVWCGQMSLYVLWLLSKGYQFEDIVLNLKKELNTSA